MIRPKETQYYRKKENERCAALARTFFETKTRNDYYEVSGEQWVGEGDNVNLSEESWYVHLSLEEAELLGKVIEENEDVLFLSELEEQIPFFDKLRPDDNFEPIAVDLLHPNRYYTFIAVIPDIKKDKVQKRVFQTSLTDEEYLSLLQWRLLHREDSFQGLSSYNPQLYVRLLNRFQHELDNSFFLILTKEIDDDVYAAVGEPNFNDTVFDDQEGNSYYLIIQEKVLDSYAMCDGVLYKELKEIDAIAVQNALGATCYDELFNKMKERFGHSLEDFDRFKDFLDENNIRYKFNDWS